MINAKTVCAGLARAAAQDHDIQHLALGILIARQAGAPEASIATALAPHARAETVLAAARDAGPLSAVRGKDTGLGEIGDSEQADEIAARRARIDMLVARGLQSDQIARELGVSRSTVNNDRRAIRRARAKAQ